MNKLKLFEHTYNKLSIDKGFMAYHLEQLAIKEKKSTEDIMALLGCEPVSYYKLALCQAPPITAIDFIVRIKKIAEYANVSEVMLANIMSSSTISENSSVSQYKQSYLLQIKNIFSFPEGLVQFLRKTYQVGISAAVIILCILPFIHTKQEIKNIQSFIADYTGYTVSIKHTQLPDNTYVCKNIL
jgi:hypothetical protein